MRWIDLFADLAAALQKGSRSESRYRARPGATTRDDDQDFLVQMYRESGEQIRQAERLRMSLLVAVVAGSLLLVQLALYVDFVLPTLSVQAVEERAAWIVVMWLLLALSIAGIAITAVTRRFVTRAVDRQKKITLLFVSRPTLDKLDSYHERRPWTDLPYYVVYLVFFAVGLAGLLGTLSA